MLNNFIQNILDKIQGNSLGEGYVVYSKDIYERPIPFSKTIRRNNMKKAILVNDYASVEELNKLFDEGYTVESVDDHGVYILKCDKLKAEPIKGKSINNQLSTNITLEAQRSFDLLGEAVKQIKDDEHVVKKPHVRIEFDDIRAVPDVWIDGVKIGLSNDKPLVSLNIDWETNGVALKHKQFDVSYIDLDEDGGTRKTIREGSLA
ncbi:hypothetical protein [Leuconostoc lactis]|uniref:hypothetical protein n=1 Tax=Leuconostoc lactis TaxID=1246 RepID=UPI00351E2C6E